MPKVIVCRGRDITKQYDWAVKQSSLVIDTKLISDMLDGGSDRRIPDKLILSIRDNTMIKCLRSKRNVILIGEHKEIEQIERIDEVLEGQGNIDGVKYSWKAKDFK